jgi:hypothetical protein
VSVRIRQKNLPSAIRPLFLGLKRHQASGQVLMPRVNIIHLQGEVIAAAPGHHVPFPSTDKVEFLPFAQAEPCAWEVESGSRHRLEAQNAFVEIAASRHVGDVDGHVVEFEDSHVLRTASMTGMKVRCPAAEADVVFSVSGIGQSPIRSISHVLRIVTLIAS